MEAHFASRSLVCLTTIDHDLTQYLKSFNLPSINTLKTELVVDRESIKDPNELDLDDRPTPTGCDDKAAILRFSDYGMGPLHAHPMVSMYFGRVVGISASESPTSTQIMQHLLHYLTEYKCYQFMKDFKVDAFKAYLASLYNIKDLRLCGVLLQGDLQEEVLALKHVVHQKYAMYAETTTKELTHLQNRQQSSHTSVSRHSLTHQSSEPSRVAPNQVKLRDCSAFSPELHCLIERVQSDLNSPYSPSFGKVHKLIASYWDPPEATKPRKRQKKGSNTTSKEKLDNEDCEVTEGSAGDRSSTRSCLRDEVGGLESVARAQIVSAATEYVMLHLGGKKYLSKRLEVNESEKDESEGAESIKEKEEDQNESEEEEEVEKVVVANMEHRLGSGCEVGSADSKRKAEGREENVPEDTQGSSDEAVGSTLTLPSAPLAPAAPPVPRFEGKLHSNLLQRGSDSSGATQHSDSLQCDIAVIPPSQLQHLLPALGCINLTDVREVGRWGELLVHQYLISHFTALLSVSEKGHTSGGSNTGAAFDLRKRVDINWLNEIEESKACYDFIVTNNQVVGKDRTTYIEVKTTRYSDLNVFELSLWEWEFAVKEPRVPYHIYRVFNAGDATKVKIVVVKDVLKCVQERKIKLCLAL